MSKSPIIGVSVDQELRGTFMAKAAALGVSQSLLARHLIETGLGMSSCRLAAEIATKNRIMFHEACELVDEIIARNEEPQQ